MFDDDEIADEDGDDASAPSDAAPDEADPLAAAGWRAGDFVNGQGLLGMAPLADPATGSGMNPPILAGPAAPIIPMPSLAPPDLTSQPPDLGDFTPAAPSPGPQPADGGTSGQSQTPPSRGNKPSKGSKPPPQPLVKRQTDPLAALRNMDHGEPTPMHPPSAARLGAHGANVLPIVGAGALGQKTPGLLPLVGAHGTGAHSMPWPTPPWLTKGRPL